MKGFFGGLRKVGGLASTEVIEKDYQLHRLLHEISQNELLRSSLVFKGGTCLVKAYTGYYRFSEDIVRFACYDESHGRSQIDRRSGTAIEGPHQVTDQC